MSAKLDVLYRTTVTAYGDGRNGQVTSDDDVLDLDLTVPKEMGGPGGDLTNPEQLFAAGYAACFHTSLKKVARDMKADATGSIVTATVGIGRDDNGFGLEAELKIALPNVASREVAQQIIERAHGVCPYSRATRGNLDVVVTLA